MHNYVNTVQCFSIKQLKYSPRRVSGFGLSDGEQVERLWSFLRRFASITKEMTPSNRIDALTDALLHYRRRIIRNLRKLQCHFDIHKTVMITILLGVCQTNEVISGQF